MIALVAAAIAGFVACEFDEPNRPQPPRFNRDSVQLLSTCGADFLVRNANDVSAELTWDVEGSSANGRLTLPPRPRGQPYSEVVLKTRDDGKTRLYYENRLIESNISTGATCVARNDVPPSAPDFYPAEILGRAPMMHDPDSPGLRYQRGIVSVVFVDGTSQLTRQTLIASIGAIVIGGLAGGSGEGEYILKLVADTSLRATMKATTTLQASPSVRFAGPNYIASPLDVRASGWPISVPATARTFFPSQIIRQSPLVHDPDVPSVRYRGILSVVFADGTLQLDKQRAVASVGAVVIGGVAADKGDGVYHVNLVADASFLRRKAGRMSFVSDPA